MYNTSDRANELHQTKGETLTVLPARRAGAVIGRPSRSFAFRQTAERALTGFGS
jgi:hypothetical protein